MREFINSIIGFAAGYPLVGPLLGVVVFALLSVAVPISILTLSIAAVFPFWEGIFVLVCGYFLGILLLYFIVGKFLNWFVMRFKVSRHFSGTLGKGAGVFAIILASMSIPFVPLISFLRFLEVPRQKVLSGVFLGGIPMMLLTYGFSKLGIAYFQLSDLRYLSAVLLIVYILWIIFRIVCKDKDCEA